MILVLNSDMEFYEKFRKDSIDRYDIHHTSVYDDNYIQVGDKIFMQQDIEPISED